VQGNCRPWITAPGCTMCPCALFCQGDFNTCCSYPGTMTTICVDANNCP
jgi:hypothetical protein